MIQLLIGTDGSFSSDEAVVAAQVDLLVDTGSWTFPSTQDDLGLDGNGLPLPYSDVFADGSTAPYRKHPAFVALLAAPWSIGGRAAAQLLVVGTVVAAAAASAVIAKRLRPGLEIPTLWAVGLASPLFADGFLLMGHAPAAALAGWGSVLALQLTEDDELGWRRWRVAALLVCVFAGPLIRAESMLFGVALALALVVGRWKPRREITVLAVAVAVAAAAGRLANGALVRFTVDQQLVPGPVVDAVGSGNRLDDLISGFRVSVLSGSYLAGAATRNPTGAVVLAALSVLLVRFERSRALSVLPAGLAALLWLGRLRFPLDPVPGLLAAFPLMGTGVLALAVFRGERRGALRFTVVCSAAFAAAVVATQYGIGGGFEWGGRYFSLCLPLVVPAALLGLIRAGQVLGSRNRRVAAAALAASTAFMSTLALSTVARTPRAYADLIDLVDAERTGVGTPLPVVSTTTDAARRMWRRDDEGAFYVGRGATLASIGDGLLERDHDRIVVVTRDPIATVADLELGWREVGRSDAVGFHVVQVFERR